jgi:hypothetical protein
MWFLKQINSSSDQCQRADRPVCHVVQQRHPLMRTKWALCSSGQLACLLLRASQVTAALTQLDRVSILAEALPYMQRFAGKTIVVKYGGAAMKDPTLKVCVVQRPPVGPGPRSRPHTARQASVRPAGTANLQGRWWHAVLSYCWESVVHHPCAANIALIACDRRRSVPRCAAHVSGWRDHGPGAAVDCRHPPCAGAWRRP